MAKITGPCVAIVTPFNQDETINADALRLPKTLSKRQRLLHALRPPFLDGYPLGPFQWLKKKWRQLRGKETPLLND